jgi:protein-glutamine gamma-glutamyltransferase
MGIVFLRKSAMAEAASIPLVSLLPRPLTAPYRWLVYLGIVVTTIAGIIVPVGGAGIFLCFFLCTLTGLSRYLREASPGVLILFLALYLWHPSILMLILFSIYFQATYYWGGSRSTHYLWIASVGFVHLAVIATIMSSVLFPVFFVAYVVLLTRALLVADFLAGMTREDGTIDRRELNRNENLLIRRLRAISYWISGFSIVLAVLFFPVLPRVEGLAYQPSQLSQESVSGFSDEVTLGGMGNIQTDNRVALRVFVPKQMVRRISRWRGAALEKWDSDAQKWSSDPFRIDIETKEKSIPLYTDNQLSNLHLDDSLEGLLSKDEIKVNVAAMSDPRLFLPEVDGRMPWMVASVKGDFTHIGFDSDSWTAQPRGDNRRETLQYRGFDYRLRLLNEESAVALRPRPDDVHPSVLRRCLSLATITDSFLQRLEARGEEILPGFKNRNQDPLDVTQRLSAGLQNSQSYTLDFSEDDSAHSLDEFVFNKKSGNCEYFATTLALLLRSYGIPARLITGFQAGRESLFGNYLMIRQSDAHSWVEVFIPEQGWMSFDPTPSSGAGLGFISEHFGLAADVYDFLQLQWSSYVLDYSQSDQRQFFGQIFDTVPFRPEGVRNVRSWFRLVRPVVALVLFIVFLVWLGRELAPEVNPVLQSWSLNFPSFGWLRFRRRSGHMATRLFLKVEKAWARKGLHRKTGETPKTFLGRVGMNIPECREQCERFVQLYNHSRFGVLPDETSWMHEMRTLTTDLLLISRNGKS